MADFLALSFKELPLLMKHLQAFLPNTMPIYFTADNATRGRLSPDEVQFYVDTWPEPTSVVLVSPAKSGQLYNYRTTVELWATNTQIMVDFLRSNTCLDWSQPIFFRVVQPVAELELKTIHTVFEEKNGTYNTVERHLYTLGSTPGEASKSPPSDYALPKSLSQDDAEIVGRQYSAWGVDAADTIIYFQSCSARLHGAGVHTNSGDLVAYAALHHTSALGSVKTDPQHRRKGLGEIAVTDVCRKLLTDNQTPYVFVNPENVASSKLYEKCGFEFSAVSYRMRFVPKEM